MSSKLDYLNKKYKPVVTQAPPPPSEELATEPGPVPNEEGVTHRIGLRKVSAEEWLAHQATKDPKLKRKLNA